MRKRTYQAGIGLASLAAISGLAIPACSAASQETVLYRFAAGSDGSQPLAGLIADAAGNLYGTTSAGGGSGCGGSGCGTVFELAPQQGEGWNETVLHSFVGGADGEYPNVALIVDANGNLYGTTEEGGSDNCGAGSGCGTVFEIYQQNQAWQEKTLYSFTTKAHDGTKGGGNTPQISKPDVWSPNGIVAADNGKLYGFASLGGRCDQNGHLLACYGGGFELKNSNGAPGEHVIYRVKNTLEAGPEGPPLFGTNGDLFGVTASANYGSVFSLEPVAGEQDWKEKTLYTFQGGSDGGYPAPGLIFDSSGNLYGATTGYNSLAGNVFELKPAMKGNWSETPLYTFSNSAAGETPAAAPILGTGGNLYGLTEAGGQNNLGVAYELAPQNGGWNETVMYSFAGSKDGATPQGAILFSSGNFYGVTYAGGNGGCYESKGCGTIFEIVP